MVSELNTVSHCGVLIFCIGLDHFAHADRKILKKIRDQLLVAGEKIVKKKRLAVTQALADYLDNYRKRLKSLMIHLMKMIVMMIMMMEFKKQITNVLDNDFLTPNVYKKVFYYQEVITMLLVTSLTAEYIWE